MCSADKRFKISLIVLVLFVALCACLFLCAGAGEDPHAASFKAEAAEPSLNGGGTQNNPYLISSAADLASMAALVNGTVTSYRQAYYSVTADIRLGDLVGAERLFTPIGTLATPFNGTFSGNGKLIYDLDLTATSSTAQLPSGVGYVGLFGYLGSGATISGIGIVNASYGRDTTQYVGGIAGYNGGRIEQSFFEGTVRGDSFIGGIAGLNAGTITRCFANGTLVSLSVNARIGGLAGENDGSISYSYNQCAVTATLGNAYHVGGAVGYQNGNMPLYCYYNASVNPSLKALGASSSGAQTEDTATLKGYTSQQMDSSALTEFFGADADNYWVRKYKLNDHSGYTGPLLKVFDVSGADDKALSAAVTLRMYGIDRNSDAVWGSSENPYLISSAAQLNNLAVAVNEYSVSYSDCCFLMTSDIYLSGTFSGIGVYAGVAAYNRPFGGVFDGGNNTIHGLNVEGAQISGNNYAGLFGYAASGAEIKNLTLAADCTISGGSYVGSVVGYASGITVRNVESRAEVVSLNGNSGGITGYDERGRYYSVLSAVTLTAPESVSTMYGIVGGGQSAPTSVINVWYLAPDRIGGEVNRYRSSNSLGGVLRVDTECGTVSAAKTGEGNIIFTASPYSGWDTEYRYFLTEQVASDGDVFEAPYSEQYNGSIIYARFVKQISALSSGATTVTFRGLGDSYYIGQTYKLEIKISDGHFLSMLRGGSGSGIYEYEAQTGIVLYSDVMEESTYSLNIETAEIAYDSINFASTHVYDAEPVEFDPAWLNNVPEGFRTDIVYDGGSAPINVSSSGAQYTFRIVYYNEQSVRVGSRNVSFSITPAPISIDEAYLAKSKEWDNSDLPVPSAVAAEGISGIYDGDILNVTAQMTFSTREITSAADITYKFVLSGADAVNYSAPGSITLRGVGEITRRSLYFEPTSLQGVYSGRYPSFSSWKVIGEVAEAKVNPSFGFEKVVSDGAGGYIPDTSSYVKGDAGLYKVTVTIDDNVHYVPYLKGAAEGTDYLIYEVIPLEVTVLYSVNGVNAASSDLTYNGGAFAVDAKFINANGKFVALATKIYLGGVETAEVANAGEYYIEVAGFTDGNYSLVNDASEVFTVKKADQAPLAVTALKDGLPVSEMMFTDTVVFKVTGGSIESGIVYETVYGDATTGDGAVTASGEFDAVKAGTVLIRATRYGNENYNDVSAETLITVLKSELKVSFAEEVTVDYLDKISFRFAYKGLRKSDTEPAGLSGLTVLVEGVAFDPQKTYDADEYELTLDVSKATADGYTFALAESAVSKLTVNRRAVEIRAKNASSVYGEPDAAIEFEIMDDKKVTVDMLAGSLSREEDSSVGKYDVTLGTLGEANPNFSISLYGGEDAYEITKAKLTVKMIAQSKYYGDPDPAVKYVVEGLAYEDTEESIGLIDISSVVSRVTGEAAYLNGIVGVSYDYALRAGTKITHASPNYEAEVAFEKASLTIMPAAPLTSVKPTASVDAKCSLSAVSAPEAVFNGTDGTELDGTYSWKDEGYVPDFTDSATVVCTAVFVPADLNYSAVEYEVEMRVIPISVQVTFTGSNTVTYTGKEQPEVAFELSGADEGDDLGVEVTYSGDRVNAGSYKATVTLSNKNYAISGSASFTVKINKAVLTVTLTESEITVLEGETVDAEIFYYGFVGDDDESVLTSEAYIEFPEEPGEYKISPEGAAAANYSIEYETISFNVNRKYLYPDNSDVIFEGSFPADLGVTFVEVDSAEEGIDSKFAGLKAAYKALEDKSLTGAYRLDYLLDKEEYDYKDKIKLSVMVDEKYDDFTKLAFAAVTYDGDIIYISDVTYIDGRAVFEVENAEYVVMAYSAGGETNVYLYAGIGAGAAVLLIIIIFAAVKLKKRRAARFIKYKDDVEE